MKVLLLSQVIHLQYRNSHYFRSQIFHVRNFRVTIFSSFSRMRHIVAMYNTIGK